MILSPGLSFAQGKGFLAEMLDRKPLTKSRVTHQEMPILLSLFKRILNKMRRQKASTTVTPLLGLQSDSFVNVRKGKSLGKACLLGKPVRVCVCVCVHVCVRGGFKVWEEHPFPLNCLIASHYSLVSFKIGRASCRERV